MRVPVCLVWCAALLATARAAHEPQEAAQAPAADTLAYLLPRLTARYRPSGHWNGITDPDLYVDTAALAPQEPEERYKRANRPSLSIINPLDVLRQRLLLEMARRQMRETQKQVAENRQLMNDIGKRSGPAYRYDTM